MQTITLPKGPREKALARAIALVSGLPEAKAWTVQVKERRNTRSLNQNSYLWGVVYPHILNAGGETLGGWCDKDMHEYLLGEWSGWQYLPGIGGRNRARPNKRSHGLSKMEFVYFVEFIVERMKDMGIDIPPPDSELTK